MICAVERALSRVLGSQEGRGRSSLAFGLTPAVDTPGVRRGDQKWLQLILSEAARGNGEVQRAAHLALTARATRLGTAGRLVDYRRRGGGINRR